jgi:hypothetical protein
MRSKRSQEGYFLVDHRAVAAPRFECGPAPGGATFESATITCSHCNVVVVLNPDRTRARGYCSRCDHYVCDNPACSKDCVPLSQLFDAVEREAVHGRTITDSLIAQLRREILNG